MLRPVSIAKTLLILLCIGLVAVRAGGGHFHYCFDGTEPPISLHLQNDGGVHHPASNSAQVKHMDVDVGIDVDALVKKNTVDLDLLVLLLALPLLIQLLAATRQLLPAPRGFFPLTSRCFFGIPPLRGPPL